ncbi:MAG: 3TM-type holin [bacterium]
MNPLLLSGLFDVAKGLLDRLFPDPVAKATAQLELIKMQQNGDLAALAAETDLAKAQIGVNTIEAQNTSFWVSGWRPGVGWVCCVALAYEFLIRPMLTFYSGTPAPELDMTDLYSLLAGMLGLGGLRSLEKIKGVAK